MAGHSDGGIAYENEKLNAGAAEEPRRGARSRPRGRPPRGPLERGDVVSRRTRQGRKIQVGFGESKICCFGWKYEELKWS